MAAHTIATLDRISEGRLVLGLGAGFPYPATEAEFAAAGVPFAERVGRLLETVRIWRLLWGTDAASGHHCRYWTFSDLGSMPRPTRPGGPPLWLAGGGPAALRHVGAAFDGWLPYPPEVEQYRSGWAAVGSAAVAAGRYPARDHGSPLRQVAGSAGVPRAGRAAGERPPGSPAHPSAGAESVVTDRSRASTAARVRS